MGFPIRLALQGGRAVLFCGFSIVLGPVFAFLALAAIMALVTIVYEMPASFAILVSVAAIPFVHVVGFVPAVLFSFLMSILLIVVRKSSAVLLSPFVAAATAAPTGFLMMESERGLGAASYVLLGYFCITAAFAGFATTFWAHAKGLLPGCRST